MASINVVARERKIAFKEAKRYLKDVDTVQEAMKRYIDRVVARKIKLPEVEDVLDLIGMAEIMTTAVDNMEDLLGEMSDFFADGMTANEAGGLQRWMQEKGWVSKESNVIAFNPGEAGSYMRVIFSSDAAARDFIERNPQYKDIDIGRTRKR